MRISMSRLASYRPIQTYLIVVCIRSGQQIMSILGQQNGEPQWAAGYNMGTVRLAARLWWEAVG
jgi:hypothetical protein